MVRRSKGPERKGSPAWVVVGRCTKAPNPSIVRWAPLLRSWRTLPPSAIVTFHARIVHLLDFMPASALDNIFLFLELHPFYPLRLLAPHKLFDVEKKSRYAHRCWACSRNPFFFKCAEDRSSPEPCCFDAEKSALASGYYGGNAARPENDSMFVFLARDFGMKVMLCFFYLSFTSIFEEEVKTIQIPRPQVGIKCAGKIDKCPGAGHDFFEGTPHHQSIYQAEQLIDAAVNGIPTESEKLRNFFRNRDSLRQQTFFILYPILILPIFFVGHTQRCVLNPIWGILPYHIFIVFLLSSRVRVVMFRLYGVGTASCAPTSPPSPFFFLGMRETNY